MNETDICFASIAELRERVRSSELSVREITAAHIARARAHEDLNAFLHLDEAGALATADRLDASRGQGAELGPLAGSVIGLKDALCTRGLPTTAGSKILEGWVPPYDATCVERLRRAGAVILGKLNMDEFAMGSSTENSAYGPCRNPWDRERVPGGSSGGSAVAVAAGLCTAALGSDTGGSIRQPAGFCGVVGVKPTYGRVSRYGLIAFASSLDCVGPLTRNVADSARLLEVISGVDPADATSLDEVPVALGSLDDASVDGLTIGLPLEYFSHALDPDVAERVSGAVTRLEQAGATVREISLPHTRFAIACYYLIAPAEASSNLARYDGVRFGARHESDDLTTMYAETRARFFGREVTRRILLGTYALRAGYCDKFYTRAQKVRRLIRGDFEAAFASGVDVIASPTSPTVPFRLGEKTSPMEMYLADLFTLSTNLAGLPGLSVPCEPGAGALPIGLQLIGRAGDEQTILRAAAVHERLTAEAGSPQGRPPLAATSE